MVFLCFGIVWHHTQAEDSRRYKGFYLGGSVPFDDSHSQRFPPTYIFQITRVITRSNGEKKISILKAEVADTMGE